MCGITFTTDLNEIKSSIEHRGPDSTTLKSFNYQTDRISMIFNRLSITGVSNGEQPFYKDEVYVLCNGEIYNHQKLKKDFGLMCSTDSDCEVILQLYLQGGRSIDTLNYIQGEYAFILFDLQSGLVIYSRDIAGVRPLFVSTYNGNLILCSELKGFKHPEYASQVTPSKHHIYNLYTKTLSSKDIFRYGRGDIRESLIQSVKSRIHSEVPIGFLLSGGLDSSLVLSIASRFIHDKITVFTTGFSMDAPDVIASKKVIEYLESKYGKKYIHHIYIPTIEEGIESIPNVIESIESYDTTTVRASTPMWLLAKYIKEKTNVKVVLSGEGSDEINGSYLYFHYAPTEKEFDDERRKLLDNIHFFDGLRADRTISAFGLELRVPFLDTFVITDSLNSSEIYSSMKESGIEKFHIRQLFEGYLPNELLWRTKAAFSDAVSFNWKASIQKYAKNLNIQGGNDYSHLNPVSDEDKWYRLIFENYYPNCGQVIPYKWLPNWVDTNGEPSATVLEIHSDKMLQQRDLEM